MNRFLNKSLLFVSLALAGSLGAETEEKLPPLPDQVMPARMPADAAWEVTYSYNQDGKSSRAKPASMPPGGLDPNQSSGERAKPETISVSRTGDIIRERITWSDARETEKWIFRKGLQIIEAEPGGNLVRLPASYLVSDYTDYSQGDFPGFLWIGKETYTSFREIEGRPCFIFTAKAGTSPTRSGRQREMDRLGIPPALGGFNEPHNDLLAAIDSKTLLPVFLDDGDCRKTYRILPPPAGPLEMPPAFAKEFDDWVDQVTEARRLPTPP